MIVTSQTDTEKAALFDFLKSRKVLTTPTTDFQAIGRVNKELALQGVVGYNGFCGLTCAIHVAGDGNWISRDLLWAAFDYPFQQLKMEYLFGPVAADNLRAIKLNTHLGFEIIQSIPNGWQIGTDLLIFGMARKDCRYLTRLRKAA